MAFWVLSFSVYASMACLYSTDQDWCWMLFGHSFRWRVGLLWITLCTLRLLHPRFVYNAWHRHDYAKNYFILFNSSKSKCLIVLPDESVEISVKVADHLVHFVLGQLITNQLLDKDDIFKSNKRRHDFVGQVNNVLCIFSQFKSFVFHKYIYISIHQNEPAEEQY